MESAGHKYKLLTRADAYQKVAGHPYTYQRHSQTLANLCVNQREGNGDAQTSAQDLVQEAVPRVVVVLAIAARGRGQACVPITIGNYPLIARVTRFTSTLETVYDKNMSGSKKKNPLLPSYEEGELRDKSIEKKQRAGFQPKDLLRIIRRATEKAPDGA